MDRKKTIYLGMLILVSVSLISFCAWMGGATVFLQCTAFVLAAVIPIGIGFTIALRHFENQRLGVLIMSISMGIAFFSASTVGMFMDSETGPADTANIFLYGVLIGLGAFGFTYVATYGFTPLLVAVKKAAEKKDE